MTKIIDITSALQIFEEAANNHAMATEQGDYRSANKSYRKLIMCIDYLKDQNSVDRLLGLLVHSSTGVRMWAATYLLPKYEKESLLILEGISKKEGIHSLTARTTIDEWKKGNLKL